MNLAQVPAKLMKTTSHLATPPHGFARRQAPLTSTTGAVPRAGAGRDPSVARSRRILGLLGLVWVFAMGGAFAQLASPPLPENLTYQGFLVDANGAPLGTNAPANYDVVFRLWADPLSNDSANNLIWSEQQTVTVDKGYFSVLLGAGSSYSSEPYPKLSSTFARPDANARYMEVTVLGIGPASTPNVTILPRLRLLPGPYAFLAQYARAAGSLVTASNQTVLSVSSTNVGINTASPSTALEVKGTITATAFAGSNATFSGTVTAPAFSGSDAKLSGTVTASTFSGANATLTGTVNAQTFSGVNGTFTSLNVNGGLHAKGGPPGANDNNNTGYMFSAPGDSDSGMSSSAQGQIEFYNNSSEVMRVKDGMVGIGTTAPGAMLDINSKSQGNATSGGLRLEDPSDSGYWNIHPWSVYFNFFGYTGYLDYLVFSFGNNETASSPVYSYLSTSTTGLITTSDRRSKKDIEPMGPCLDRVMALKPSTFRYQSAPEGTPVNYGFIAQDIEEQFPDLVQEMNGLKTLAGAGITAINTRGLQELTQQVRQKEERIQHLESEMERLKSLVESLSRDRAADPRRPAPPQAADR